MLYNNHNSNDFLYIDLCRAWGRGFLLKRETHQQFAEADWQVLLESGKQPSEELGKEFVSFAEKVKKAVTFLQSEECCNLDEDCIPFLGLPDPDEEEYEEDSEETEHKYQRLYEAFLTLDQVVFLMIASKNFQKIRDNTAFHQQVSELFDYISSQIPTLRLIPLNKFRQKQLAYIPSDYHYLFSWYDSFNNLPSDIFETFIMSKAGLLKTNEDSQDLIFIERELLDDPALAQRLKRNIQNMKLTSQALDEAYKLRWFLTADEEAQNFRLPSDVVKASTAKVLFTWFFNALQKGENINEIKFKAGFCGLRLSEQVRFKLMEPIEKEIKQNRRKGTPLRGFARKVASFPSEKQLASSMFNTFLSELEATAKAGVLPVPDFAAEKFYLYLLSETGHKVVSFIREKVINRICNLLPYTAPVRLYSPATLGPNDQQQSMPEVITVEPLALPLPAPQTRRGKTYLSLLQETEAATHRTIVRNWHYWGGVGYTDDQEIPIPVTDSANITIDAADYRLVILGISKNKQLLENALVGQEYAKDDNTTSEIVWVFYVRPDVPDADDKGATSD